MAIVKLADVARALRERMGLTFSDPAQLQALRAAYNSINIAELQEAARQRITVRDWQPGDRAPTGVLYEDVHPELKNGAKAYELYLDGRLLYFQYTHPETGKYMYSDAELEDAKKKHVAMIVEDLVNSAIHDLVAEKIIAG